MAGIVPLCQLRCMPMMVPKVLCSNGISLVSKERLYGPFNATLIYSRSEGLQPQHSHCDYRNTTTTAEDYLFSYD